jgi:DNA-binding response OmpR family regulator
MRIRIEGREKEVTMVNSKILIVDDDKNICRLIDLYLKDAGYDTLCCHDGSAALDIIKMEQVDLVLLDLMIPIINGWEVCKLIKLEKSVPIIMISARDLIEDKLSGFDAGADDYIVKPFDPKELVARVRARLKQTSTEKSDLRDGADKKECLIVIGNLTVDIEKYEVKLKEQIIELKPKEIQLLFFLLKNKNIVFTRDQLLEKIWDYSYSGDTRTVDVHIKSLRDKLGNGPDCCDIKTIWGVGYKMEVK